MKRRVKKAKIKKATNPYPKYSYHSGIVTDSGESVWGIDTRWSAFEIKQGNGLPPLELKCDSYNFKRKQRKGW